VVDKPCTMPGAPDGMIRHKPVHAYLAMHSPALQGRMATARSRAVARASSEGLEVAHSARCRRTPFDSDGAACAANGSNTHRRSRGMMRLLAVCKRQPERVA
jgi:hypothetical protein